MKNEVMIHMMVICKIIHWWVKLITVPWVLNFQMFSQIFCMRGSIFSVFSRSLRKKVRRLEKSTPLPVVAVVTNMSYAQSPVTVHKVYDQRITDLCRVNGNVKSESKIWSHSLRNLDNQILKCSDSWDNAKPRDWIQSSLSLTVIFGR